MITVHVFQEEKYPIKDSDIETDLSHFLTTHGVTGDISVFVSIVSDKTMLEVSNRYLKDNAVHDVLSFPTSELKGSFVTPPTVPVSLGDIVVCFDMVKDESKADGIPVERKILDLIQHGALHLLGIHHE
jgi:probable rRNA maturation factor